MKKPFAVLLLGLASFEAGANKAELIHPDSLYCNSVIALEFQNYSEQKKIVDNHMKPAVEILKKFLSGITPDERNIMTVEGSKSPRLKKFHARVEDFLVQADNMADCPKGYVRKFFAEPSAMTECWNPESRDRKYPLKTGLHVTARLMNSAFKKNNVIICMDVQDLAQLSDKHKLAGSRSFCVDVIGDPVAEEKSIYSEIATWYPKKKTPLEYLKAVIDPGCFSPEVDARILASERESGKEIPEEEFKRSGEKPGGVNRQ